MESSVDWIYTNDPENNPGTMVDLAVYIKSEQVNLTVNQKYAFIKKFTIFNQSLETITKLGQDRALISTLI